MSATDDDLLEIITRSASYFVSKRLLCSSIPYFEKVFSCAPLDPRENKVTLDFDSIVFNNILSFVSSDIFSLEMKNVFQTYDLCDYLMIDGLKKHCSNFFYKNFTIEQLPIVIQEMNVYAKMITPETLNCFIRRYFQKISNTNAFLEFPFDVIVYICKLDLIVDSEYQVFDAIRRWIDKNIPDAEDLTRLMKCIRWCFLHQNDLEKVKSNQILIDSVKDFDQILIASNLDKNFTTNRTVVNSPMAIYKVDEARIGIVIFDETDIFLPCGQFDLDETLSNSIITDEHITDVFYDSGSQGIRIDWKERKFNYLKLRGYSGSYYEQIHQYIMYDHNPVKNEIELNEPLKVSPPWRKACIINERCYIIQKENKIFQVNLTKNFEHLYKDQNFSSEEIQLYNHGDQLLLFDGTNNSIYICNKKSKEWKVLTNIATSNKFIAISSTYTPSKSINSLYIVK